MLNETEPSGFAFFTDDDLLIFRLSATLLITEKCKLLDLTDRLQKQNEVLMLPAPKPKSGWWQRLTGK